MKKLFIYAAMAASMSGCVGSRYVPDKSMQVTLVKAYKEPKEMACGMPRKLRTWHIELKTKEGKIITHHYFTESFATQRWLVPGDQYTLSYRMQDSIHCEFSYIYAKLVWNK